MRAIYINLDRATDRRQWIEAQATLLALDVERMSAVNGALLQSKNDKVSLGALACFYSHRNVWKMISGGEDPYVAVLEDDVHMSPDLPKFLSHPSWIPSDADIIHLGRSRKRCVVINDSIEALDRRLYRTVSENSGTESYIISKRCARRLFDEFDDIDEEFDQILFDKNKFGLNIYKLVPSLCIQDQFTENPKFDAQIQRMTNPKRKGSKIFREASRLIAKIRYSIVKVLGLRAPVRVRISFR